MAASRNNGRDGQHSEQGTAHPILSQATPPD